MTLEQLEAYSYGRENFSREIARYDEELKKVEIEAKKRIDPPRFQAEYDEAINELRQVLIEGREKRKTEWEKLKTEVETFFDEIDDFLTKAIFVERFINGKQWWDVVDAVADFGRFSVDMIKQQCYRYLKKSEVEAKTDA